MMRATKLAIAEALRTDASVAQTVPPGQVYSVERATLPTLPSIECIGVSSEPIDSAMVKHSIAIEVTVTSAAEDDADALLDAIVRAVRRRLSDAEQGGDPISLVSRQTVLCELGGTRWSVSASGSSGVIRGAAVDVQTVVNE